MNHDDDDDTTSGRAALVAELDAAHEVLALALALASVPDDRHASYRTWVANLRGTLVGLPGSRWYRTPPAGSSELQLTDRTIRECIRVAQVYTSRINATISAT